MDGGRYRTRTCDSRFDVHRYLRLILGGRSNIDDAAHDSLLRLEIVRVLGIERIDPSLFPNLEGLLIEDQIRLESLVFRGSNPMLKMLQLINCKALKVLSGLAPLEQLEHLRISKTALNVDTLIADGLPPSLKVFGFYTGKNKENHVIRERLDACGFRESAKSE